MRDFFRKNRNYHLPLRSIQFYFIQNNIIMAELKNNPQNAKIDALIYGQNLKDHNPMNQESTIVRDQILQSLAALEENIMTRIHAVRNSGQSSR